MKQKFLSVFLFLFCISSIAFPQVEVADSLLKIARQVPPDSASRIYVKVATIFTSINSDSVRKYARMAKNTAAENSVSKGTAMIQIGNSFNMENKLDSALNYYNSAFLYFSKIGNEKGIAQSYQSFALVKRASNDYEGAINDSKKAMEIFKKIHFTVGVIGTTNNISNMYMDLGKSDLALSYSKKAFDLARTLGDSVKYFDMMQQLGKRYMENQMPDSALYYLLPAENYFERNEFHRLLIAVNGNIADAYWAKNKNTQQAVKYLYKSLHYSNLSGAADNLVPLYRSLAGYYLIENRKDSAQICVDLAFAIGDSLNAEQALEQTKELQTKYETEKKDLQIRQQESDILIKESENKRKSLIIWLSALALLGSATFGIIAFANFKKTKKAKKVIEEQNKEINNQKELLEEKQREIKDSITYAKRLQEAILPPPEYIDRFLPNNFILYKPKDIVAGDFYWAEAVNDLFFIAAADSTGHGVPGAMVSVVCNNALNRAIKEFNITDPGKILDKTRDLVLETFSKSSSEVKDGMDISLLCIDKKQKLIQWSGANNPLWYVQDNELKKIRANKQAIGKTEYPLPFTTNTIAYKEGTSFYLFTDGFADQFGGTLGKKFKYKQLENLLLAIQTKSLPEQKKTLEDTFNSWKGTLDQVDDVCLLGIKL